MNDKSVREVDSPDVLVHVNDSYNDVATRCKPHMPIQFRPSKTRRSAAVVVVQI